MVESFAIVATEAGPNSRHIHDRQPLILDRAHMTSWLDLTADAAELMRPSPEGSVGVRGA